MASEVRKIVRLFEDEEVRESFGWWIVELAKRIKEKPEDVVWFFERRAALKRFEREADELAKKYSDEELWKLAVEVAEGESKNAPPVRKSAVELLEEARAEMRKFRRIEKKLKRIGVI